MKTILQLKQKCSKTITKNTKYIYINEKEKGRLNPFEQTER